MSRSQLQDSEATAIPDKAMLATVLNYLKNKNLKDTVETLQKELSTQGGADTSRSLGPMQFSSMGQSGTEPMKYEESYTSQAPFVSTPTTPTAAYLKLANSNAETSTSLNKASKHPIFAVPSLTASTSPNSGQDMIDDSTENSNGEVVASSPRSLVNDKGMTSSSLSPPPLTRSPGSSGRAQDINSTAVNALKFPTVPLLMPAAKALDKTPLWFQNAPVPSSVGNGKCHPIFLPSVSAGGIVGGQNIAGVRTPGPPPPPLMYQLMTPPTNCVTRPYLGANTAVLTVLPSPQTTNLVNPQSVFLVANQSLGGKPQQVLEDLPKQPSENQFAASAAMDMEPATGQAQYPSAVSSTTTPTAVSSPPPHPRTLASIPHSELTPQHLELKAFAEDFKTRRIRLGFTQGAVGTSLAEKGYNNFAQSTISRFEQMQLSPANAATIRVILEKWLREAESPDTVPSNQSNDLPVMAGRKRKKRAVFTPQTKSTLDEFFTQNPRPNRQAIENISQKLDLLPEEVRVWFCNKRQKSKSGSVSTLYDHDSSTTSSSGVPSPATSEGGLSQKYRSPSPKTPFTIEELSKSSYNGNSGFITSPVHLSTSSLLPLGGLVASVTQSMTAPMIFTSGGTPSVLFGGAAAGNKSPTLILPPHFLASSPIITDRSLN